MVKANLRLVAKIANDFVHCGLPLEDLICEGNIGLMKAAERFDPSFGAKFSTYAAWWINQRIKRALCNQSRTIRLPLHVIEKLRGLDKASVEIMHETGREPRDSALAARQGVPVESVSELRRVSQPTTSLDAPVTTNEGSCSFGALLVADPSVIDPVELADSKQLRENLAKALAQLNKREREILISRFGLAGQSPRTLEEVGEVHGVTRERIRQIQNQALEKMQQILNRMNRPYSLPPIPRDRPAPEAIPA